MTLMKNNENKISFRFFLLNLQLKTIKEMMNKTKVLIIRFENEIRREEIVCFRGAVIHAMENANVLFHNHTDEDGLRYAYPLIQYKRINQKAAIVCLGEGTEAIGEFFAGSNFDVVLGDHEVHLAIDHIDASQCLVQCWDEIFSYHLRRWLPFNKQNYENFQQLESIADKCVFLERLLVGNMLSFAKGLGIRLEQEVVCKITQLSEPMTIVHKGVRLMGFDVEFRTNVSLPDYIGLGKGVSVGKGTVSKKRTNN